MLGLERAEHLVVAFLSEVARDVDVVVDLLARDDRRIDVLSGADIRFRGPDIG